MTGWEGGKVAIDEGERAGSFWLEHLRSRAGLDRCFNCLAPSHRIASCRDPPKCLRCFRFGHKARFCLALRSRSPVAPAALDASLLAAASASAAASAASCTRRYLWG
jgi:hypothetical protein